MRVRSSSLLVAVVLTVALAYRPPAASAADLVDLHGPFLDDARLIAFRGSLDYRWLRRELAVRREIECVAHEVIEGASACPDGSRTMLARDLRATSFTSSLDIDLHMAFYAAFEVRLRLPFVLSEEALLDFDGGVDGRNSPTAPYNTPALFAVPNQSTRAGFGDPVVGIWGSILSSARDARDPTLSVGFEVAFPLAAPRKPGGDEIGSGAWALTFALAAADRSLPWLEPFFRLDATFTVPGSDALYPDLGETQITRGPPDRAGVRFGAELIPFERPAQGNAVRIEVGAELAFVSAGKLPTVLFDALGTSACSPDGEPACDLTTHAVGTRASGATIVEEHMSGGLWVGTHFDVLEKLRLSARVSVGWESPHFLTNASLGVDLDGGGVDSENRLGQNEHDPDYNPAYDAPGTRFRASEATLLGVELAVTGRF